MDVLFGRPGDLDAWMALVRTVAPEFPGLETEADLEAHRQTVAKCIGRGEALCVRDGEAVVGVLLYSSKRNMICCLAVAPERRRLGIGDALLTAALARLDRSRDITVSTFRDGDPKGVAPRRLYVKHGFEPRELTVEFDYPNQVFVLPAKG